MAIVVVVVEVGMVALVVVIVLVAVVAVVAVVVKSCPKLVNTNWDQGWKIQIGGQGR